MLESPSAHGWIAALALSFVKDEGEALAAARRALRRVLDQAQGQSKLADMDLRRGVAVWSCRWAGAGGAWKGYAMSSIDTFWVLKDTASPPKLFITAAFITPATTADGQTFTAIGPRFSDLEELKAYVQLLIDDLRDLPAMAERMLEPER